MRSTAAAAIEGDSGGSSIKRAELARYGRGAGVGRGLGVGEVRGVAVALAVAVAVAVGVGVAVAVGVGVGVGVPHGVMINCSLSLSPKRWRQSAGSDDAVIACRCPVHPISGHVHIRPVAPSSR